MVIGGGDTVSTSPLPPPVHLPLTLTHAQNETADTLFFVVPRSVLIDRLLIVDGKSRRYAMVPAYDMVFFAQNRSTGNGQVPGCSFILSVRYPFTLEQRTMAGFRFTRPGSWSGNPKFTHVCNPVSVLGWRGKADASASSRII